MAAHVITVANTKGGVGKSTLAVNLAVFAARQGQRVLVIDADPQGSIMQFITVRDGDTPAFQAVQITRPVIHTQVPELAEGYDLVVVDAGDRDNPALRTALLAADTILVPSAPSAFDTWAAEDMLSILRELAPQFEQLRILGVVNKLDQTVIARDALENLREQLADSPVELLDTPIYHRTAWARSIGEGLAVVEHEPRGKAAAEFARLVNALGITP